MIIPKGQKRSKRRATGVRGRITVSVGRPRLSVFRSNRHIYAQVIDGVSGRVLVSASSLAVEIGSGEKTAAARAVGKALAERAAKSKVVKVAFDRGPYRYHGRVKALAEGAREGGLEF